MQKITIFQTIDGQQFSTADEAHNHEVGLEAIETIKQIVSVTYKTGRADSVLMEIIENYASVRDVLNNYQKRLRGKRKIAA